ncbi:MAG: hypothetical protein WAU36_11265 [Cyclobacteriaceae bacterium]
MTKSDFKAELSKYKLLFTSIVSALILSLLFWQHFHDGVPSHYILQNKDLPEISNWWGGLLLPALTWLLLSRVEKRINKKESESDKEALLSVLKLLIIGLVFGLLLAISFTNDYKPFLDNVLYILLILCLIIPIYYSEFILGFVLGMTYTFGAILPTAFVLIMAGIGFLLFTLIRPLFVKLFKSLKK